MSYTCHAPASHFVHARRRSEWLSGHLWILQVLAVMPVTTIVEIYESTGTWMKNDIPAKATAAQGFIIYKNVINSSECKKKDSHKSELQQPILKDIRV